MHHTGGVTKPITLEAKWRGKKTIPGCKTCICFTATGSLNRFDYGLRWNELTEAGRVIAGETVELTIELALVKEE